MLKPLRAALQTVTTSLPAALPAAGATKAPRLPYHSIPCWMAGWTKVLSLIGSGAVASCFLIHSFGFRTVLTAASRANLALLVGAVALGAAIQVVRAQRARCLLGQRHPVSLSATFAAMVVGHGLGDLFPFAPGGPVLRSVLTERLTGIPVAFSGGVYIVEGILDVVSPALFVPYLLLVLSLPGWARWVLAGIGGQAALLLAVSLLLPTCWQACSGRWPSSLSTPQLERLSCQVRDGLGALGAAGRREVLMVVGLSLLITALAACQVSLFLRAVGFSTSANDLLLLVVVMLGAGAVPLKIPAFGTLTVAAILPLAAIHGPEVGAYLLISQFILSSETAALAAMVIGWWFARGDRSLEGIGRRAQQSPGSSISIEQAA